MMQSVSGSMIYLLFLFVVAVLITRIHTESLRSQSSTNFHPMKLPSFMKEVTPEDHPNGYAIPTQLFCHCSPFKSLNALLERFKSNPEIIVSATLNDAIYAKAFYVNFDEAGRRETAPICCLGL